MLKSKKAQIGLHMWGFADIFIILFGVILGLALAWFGLNNGYLPTAYFCPA